MNSNNCVSLTISERRLSKEAGSHKTLRLRYVKHLALALGISNETLSRLAENASEYYRTFNREVKGKNRRLVEATGLLKTVQRRILDNVLLRLPSFESSFGQTKGRTIKDNAKVHAHAKYVIKLDIKDFYPSIHSTKVYRYFVEKQLCSPDVAHILTALTTRDYALPLGTSTSPMLADLIVRPIDVRVIGMAKKVGLKYTRYVDDLTLSGDFRLERMMRIVLKVLKQSGFKTKKEKLTYYRPVQIGEERIITGVRIADGRISAPLSYVGALKAELKAAIYQSRREIVEGEFQTREHYRGKIAYVKWLDPRLGQELLRLYRKVKWRHLEWATEKVLGASVG
ncbi:MAG: reverse transcriptase family protein [Planctomycetota bacterium]|jgi:RNA-directed DNA polymerase